MFLQKMTLMMWTQSPLVQTVFVAIVTALVGSSQAQHHKLPNGGEIKAVLVSAANGWNNYGVEAAVCHAYQVLRGNGIPEENIIVMMYDDIAHNEENPQPGVIINRPGGPNVYKNVKKDYVGEDVNKEVFFDVLLGNKTAVQGIGSGRVLESGPNDHVFINYVDHGLPHILGMNDESIYASELIQVLENMAGNSTFSKLFLYIETCYSGSVASLIPKNLNIFAMTAANTNESAWCCYLSNDTHTMDGVVAIAYEFGVQWMRDAVTVDLRNENVQQQFEKVRKDVLQSHVSEYGDIGISNTKLSEVLGYRTKLEPYYEINCDKACGPNHELPIVDLESRIRAAEDPQLKKELEKQLQALLKARQDMATFFSKLAEGTLGDENMDDLQDVITNKSELSRSKLACYENAVTLLNDKCFKIGGDPFVGTQLHILINLCNLVSEPRILKTIQSMCHDQPERQVVL